jgi:hypothetical protein
LSEVVEVVEKEEEEYCFCVEVVVEEVVVGMADDPSTGSKLSSG